MNQLDNKDWKRVRFGDVCRNLNVTVKSPEENGYDKVIGLENIESGNLHIKTWGDIAEGTTFTKTFEPGHVLFGKRRAYLKKAAMAEFRGLCSGDILVFEAIDKILHPKLLPFIVSSDRFFEHAVKTSAGSLSPRTKFQDLANFEFSLPPINQQEKLAELLWAGNEVLEMYINIGACINVFNNYNSKAIRTGIFPGISNSSQWKKIKLKDLAEFRRGSFPQPYGNKEWFDDNGHPFVQVFDIDSNLMLKEKTKFKISGKAASQSVYASKGSMIISIQGSIGRIAITQYDAYIDRTILIFQKFKVDVNETYILFALKYLFEKEEKTAPGGTIKTITKEALSEFEIILPPLETQNLIASYFSKIRNLNETREITIESLKHITNHIINEITSNDI